nr:MAG TPA: hypothetical protein [Bacteriophage sp.]
MKVFFAFVFFKCFVFTEIFAYYKLSCYIIIIVEKITFVIL